jgi:hypothetical protein
MTLDFDPKHTQGRPRQHQRAGLGHLVEQREGAALDTLAQLVEAGEANRSTSSSSTPTRRATPSTSTGRSSWRGPAR